MESALDTAESPDLAIGSGDPGDTATAAADPEASAAAGRPRLAAFGPEKSRGTELPAAATVPV